jgi:plasmid stabilization system protein ParE
MATYPINILTPAYEDINRIAEYHLSEVGPLSAEKITDKLLDTIALLGENPFLAPEHQDPLLKDLGYRKLICGQYICLYRVVEKAIYVYRIVHASTDYPTLFKPGS